MFDVQISLFILGCGIILETILIVVMSLLSFYVFAHARQVRNTHERDLVTNQTFSFGPFGRTYIWRDFFFGIMDFPWLSMTRDFFEIISEKLKTPFRTEITCKS